MGESTETPPLPDDLRRALGDEGGWRPPVRAVLFLRETTSTNDVAMSLARQADAAGTLVVADRQTAGRGRGGHRWHSPSGAGLYVSLILDPVWPATVSAGWLTLGAGVAVARALRSLTGLDVGIKWPNDVICPTGAGWRKLGGILAEGVVLGSRLERIVLGLGINLRAVDLPDELRPVATSVEQETGRVVDRGVLLAEVLTGVDTCVSRLACGETALLRKEWEQASPMARGAGVEWHEGDEWLVGTTDGLDPDGALVAIDRSGHRRRIVAGSVQWP